LALAFFSISIFHFISSHKHYANSFKTWMWMVLLKGFAVTFSHKRVGKQKKMGKTARKFYYICKVH